MIDDYLHGKRTHAQIHTPFVFKFTGAIRQKIQCYGLPALPCDSFVKWWFYDTHILKLTQ